jgi:hypothetical protein
MNSLQVMKQTLAYLEGGHFTYETKIADDLRAAIKQEEERMASHQRLSEAYAAISLANLEQEDDAAWRKYRGNKLQAIQQEEANIQTQITKDNLQAAAVTSLECAHCQVTIETLNDKVMRTLAEVEQLKARELGLDHEPVPVKTYSGGKAWPVQTSAKNDEA